MESATGFRVLMGSKRDFRAIETESQWFVMVFTFKATRNWRKTSNGPQSMKIALQRRWSRLLRSTNDATSESLQPILESGWIMPSQTSARLTTMIWSSLTSKSFERLEGSQRKWCGRPCGWRALASTPSTTVKSKTMDARRTIFWSPFCLSSSTFFLVHHSPLWWIVLDEPRFLYPSDLNGNRLSEPFDLAKAPDINKLVYDNANSIGKEILRNCWQIDRVRRNFNYHFFLTHPNWPIQTQLGVIFSQATIPGCTTDIPIPANYHWERRGAKFADSATFDSKKPGFVWRGSSTGGDIRSHVIEWASHHRLRFQRLFGTSNNADVGITAIIQASNTKDVNKYYPIVDQISEEDQATHKFLMDIDGNSFSQRFMTFAKKYNSAIIKATIFDEFALYTLRPWIDYVPVDFSYLNVDATVDWLEKHPQVPKRIAQHANEMGEKRLRVEDMKCYWARVLLEYRSLWRGWWHFLRTSILDSVPLANLFGVTVQWEKNTLWPNNRR